MHSCGGTNPVGYISTMQAPNDPGIGSSTPARSSGALITDDRLKLQQRLTKIEEKVQYFGEQYNAAKYDLDQIVPKRAFSYKKVRNTYDKWNIKKLFLQ